MVKIPATPEFRYTFKLQQPYLVFLLDSVVPKILVQIDRKKRI